MASKALNRVARQRAFELSAEMQAVNDAIDERNRQIDVCRDEARALRAEFVELAAFLDANDPGWRDRGAREADDPAMPSAQQRLGGRALSAAAIAALAQ